MLRGIGGCELRTLTWTEVFTSVWQMWITLSQRLLPHSRSD